MEKKFLLCCASLMAMLIAGEGYSSNLPNPNSFSNLNFAQNPNPSSHSSLNLSSIASSPLDVIRLQTPAPKSDGVRYEVIPGVIEHVVWKSGGSSNMSNELWDGYFSICKTAKERLKQVKNLTQVLAPEFVIQAQEKDLWERCVVIDVVPAATCATNYQFFVSQLNMKEDIYIHSGMLSDLPSKLIPGSSLEFDVEKCICAEYEVRFCRPAELRFYSPSENSASDSNSSRSVRQRLSSRP